MGNDGLNGMTELKKTGENLCEKRTDACRLWYAKAVVDAGIADTVLSLEEMAGEIINAV